MKLPQYNDVADADFRIDPFIQRTPLLSSPHLDAMVGGQILVKAEALQTTGSFKLRGAVNAVQKLDPDVKCVVAWSSGNHAQAVAMAAGLRHIRAIIIMPEDAPLIKKQNTIALGGEVITYDRYHENREEIGQDLAEKHNAVIIPPYDYIPVIAGQGTIGIEIDQQLTKKGITADQVICPTGGGGLLAGLSIGLHHHRPDVPIYAAEPEGFDNLKKSLIKGTKVSNDPKAHSICDAILTPTLGKITFEVIKNHVAAGLSVSDDEALYAMAKAWAHLNITAEPGGAVALAAGLTQKIEMANKTSVIIVSGGNVDKDIFKKALALA